MVNKIDPLAQKFKKLVEQSDKILVVSHVDTDPDAVCSALLLKNTLAKNYPDKTVTAVIEAPIPQKLKFLQNYDQIKTGLLIDELKFIKPQLLIMADANNYVRFTRGYIQDIRQYVKANNIKTIIIDHHIPDGHAPVDLFIHRSSPAATQDVYWLLYKQLEFKRPDGYADTAMLGIISDTGRFLYKNNRYAETLDIAKELLDEGVSIEELEKGAFNFSTDQMQVIANLASNIVSNGDYSYSFVSEDIEKKWRDKKISSTNLKEVSEFFSNTFIRNIGGSDWGFIVLPDLLSKPGNYNVSLRSIGDHKDVSVIARSLGGGGHKPAAGCKVKAENVKKATQVVVDAIK